MALLHELIRRATERTAGIPRRALNVERAPTRATVIVPAVKKASPQSTPIIAPGGMLFVFTSEDGTAQVMAKYSSGLWMIVGNPFTGLTFAPFTPGAGSMRKLGNSIWLNVDDSTYGYHRSDDGGATFTPKLAGYPPNPPYVPNIAADNAIWAVNADQATVSKSTDNGDSWTIKLTTSVGYIHSVACHPSDGNTVAVFGVDDSFLPHLYITSDGGGSWSDFALPDTRDYGGGFEVQSAEFSPTSNRLLLVYEMTGPGGANDSSIRCQYSDTPTVSASFTAVNVIAPGGTSSVDWKHAPVNFQLQVSATAHFMYASTETSTTNKQFAYSTDDGVTWSVIANPVDTVSGDDAHWSGIYYDEPNDTLYTALYRPMGAISGNAIVPIVYALPSASTGGTGWVDVTGDLLTKAGLSDYGPTYGVAVASA